MSCAWRRAILAIGLVSQVAAAQKSSVKKADLRLQKFIDHPSDKGLDEVTRLCGKSAFSPEAIRRASVEVSESPNPLGLRALMKMRLNCTDGDLSLDLDGRLGRDALKKDPRLFIAALTAEKANSVFISELAEAAGTSQDNILRSCKSDCLPKLNALYSEKIHALWHLKFSLGDEKRMRERFISAVESAQHKWRTELGGD